jgi:two-component system chemotaxis response regulator CheY
MTTLQREETVLIVDDNLDSCASLAMLVMLEGYNAVTAANGLEALEYLRRHGPPRFIILDMMMPVMDGWQFLERRGPAFRSIPVIVISAKPDATLPGDVQVIAKPVSVAELIEAMQPHWRLT